MNGYVCPLFFQTQGRESIAAKLVANLITEAGANRVLACDLHSGQSMGYFDIPVDHVYGQVIPLYISLQYFVFRGNKSILHISIKHKYWSMVQESELELLFK